MADEFLSYEEVPYLGRIHFQSHLNNLATVATLFGMSPAPPASCRVLEIGCADGSNIITMAYHLPDATFVGIDGAASQIKAGEQTIAELGLKNITLQTADLRDLGESIGQFDYIIAHGIFSWIAEDARNALLKVCRERLTEQGVAYISYNTYPGWHFYDQIRGIMRFHIRGMSSIKEEIEQAKAVIRFVGTSVIDASSPRAEFFKQVMPTVLSMNPDYLYHEYLEENNRPMYFHEFIGMAMAHGMQYLGESLFNSMMSSNYPEHIRDTLDRISHNILELEQYMDFLRNRRFRCTLLCRGELTLERAVGLEPLVDFLISFSFRQDEPDNVLTEDSSLQFTSIDDDETAVVVQHPLHKLALAHLSSRWPASVHFSDIAAHCCDALDIERTAETDSDLADLFMKLFTQSFAEFKLVEPPMTPDIEERPRATRLARYQAMNSRVVSSQRHEMVQLADNQSREVIARLDGTRTIDQIVDELVPLLEEESRAAMDDPVVVLRASVEMILKRMARQGVLIPQGAETD
jgi:methyltransferase-like protein/cyclopropane fatty-acyl-phospholipid synthase-like methyltransferase